MSVSTQEVKDQIAEMRAAIETADEARRRAGKTKVIGTILAICIVVMFVWAFFSLVQGLVNKPQSIQEPFLRELEASNFTKSLAEMPVAFIEGAVPHVNEFAEEIWADEQNKKTIQAFLDKQLMPSMRRKFENDVLPQLGKTGEEQLHILNEDLEKELKNLLADRIGKIAADQKSALDAALTPAQVDEIIETLTLTMEAAAEKAVEDQFKIHEESIEGIADAQAEICKYEVEGVDDVGLRLVILRLIGYGLLAPETTEEER